MFSTRIASEATAAVRAARRPVPYSSIPRCRYRSSRFQSSSSGSSSSSNAAASGLSPAIVGGLAGSLATFGIGYVWYRRSGAGEFLAATKTTKDYISSASQKFQESTPEPNEALDWLRRTVMSYAVFIPGARGYIDTAFHDLDAIREKHGQEVDNIVREAYEELRDVAKKGELSLLSAQKAWDVIMKHLGRIGDLSGDVAQQIMDNHPQLKESVGGNVDKLKEMGQNYGPQAREEVDKTWKQVEDVIKTGVSAENIEKIQKIVQEKVNKVKQMGDEAWKKGIEQAKPYLDKNPKVKELVEQNTDALKSGNVQELYRKVKQAVESGDMGDLEQYVSKFTDKAKQSGLGGLDQYINKIPGGDQIIPKFQQLQEVAQKHGEEAERILKDAVSEISEVLKKKGDEASDLAKKAKDDTPKK